MPDWETNFIQCSPLFAPLRAHDSLCALWGAGQWPATGELQALLDAHGTVSGGGKALRLAAPDARGGAFEDRYEVRIYREGELQLRPRNWHDLFNLLVWLTFPCVKAAINARHYHALLERQSGATLNRGPAQDTLTLFDESGIIVVSSDPVLLRDVRDFAWKRLFWAQREAVPTRMRWLLFGHALYEKAIMPYVGMTGQGVLIEVERGFLGWPVSRQLAFVDAVVAKRVADPALFRATSELAPVPVLGVPGWWPGNEDERFYGNTGYFRAGRRANSRAGR